MKLQKTAIVIVDAYSTGRYIAPAFVGRGYPCIHVDTSMQLPTFLKESFEECFFLENIIMDQSGIAGIVKHLQKYNIKAVIAGSEMGVNVTDQIADQLNVPKNDIQYSINRRDKFMMIDALHKAGVSHIPQFKSSNVEQILNWYTTSKLKKVILKPVMAALSEGVSICYNEQEIRHVFQIVFGKRNVTGQTNDAMVIQQFHEGKEYIVNSVSCNGDHFITDIWLGVGGLKDKISTDQYAVQLFRNDPNFDILSSYTKQVLNALRIRHGAAHSEIKLTSQGPKLIETGARLAGGLDFSLMEEAQGYSQLSLMINATISPQMFKKYCHIYDAMPQKHVRFVYLCSYIEGRIFKEPDLKPMLSLQSIHSIIFILKPGEYLKKTNESFGRPGFVFMFAEDEQQLENDYQALRLYEEKMYLDMLEQPRDV